MRFHYTCREGTKLLKEAALKETRDKVGCGDTETASPDMNDMETASWKSVRRSSNVCVGPSTYRSDQDKGISSSMRAHAVSNGYYFRHGFSFWDQQE